jgi:hypothetical protein
MTEIVRGQLSRAEARMLTEEVKSDAQALWVKLLALYEGQAHLALGYSSWAEYCRDEFEMGKSQAYRLLDAGRVVEQLPEGHSPIGESVARELAAADDPAEAWADVVELHGEEPTAVQARSGVQELKNPATDKQLSYLRSLCRRYDVEPPAKPISKTKASRMIDELRDHECLCAVCGKRWAP